MFSAATVARIVATAKRESIDPAGLLAVAEVESAGRPFWTVKGEKLPPARFEGHYFYRLLPAAKRKRAVSLGLAHPKWGKVKNPRSFSGVYALIERAAEIDRAIAYESCSWGLGQVMGSHWRSLGYSSVFELVKSCKESVAGQVDVMVRFIQKNKLTQFINNQQWAKFAYRYNGPGYKKNRYDTKMAKAYRRWLKALSKDQKLSGVVKDANHDSLVEIQQKLKKLGYYKGTVDGLTGPKTRAAIRAFQRDNGLRIDGKYGPMTEKTVNEQLKEREERNADKALGGGAGGLVASGGTEGAASQIDQAAEGVQQGSDSLMNLVWQTSSTILTVLAVVMSLIATGLVMYGLYVKFWKYREAKPIRDDDESIGDPVLQA
jgi:hypothetical protein